MGLQVIESPGLDRVLPVRNRVEGCVQGPGYSMQLNQTRWFSDGEHRFTNFASVIQFVVDSGVDMQVKICGDADPQFRPLTGVSFVPQDVEVQCRWKPGESRTLTCVLDFERLLRLAYPRAERRDPPMVMALDLKSPNVTVAMRRLLEELLSPGFASDLQIQCLLMTVAIDLKRTLTGEAPEPAALDKGKLSRGQLEALRHLVHDADEAPTLEEMARACRVHPRYVSALFRNTCNITLRSYVAGARIERAQTLLLNQDVMIKQVAHASGFRSAAAFTAAFRKATGLTPAQYRATVDFAHV